MSVQTEEETFTLEEILAVVKTSNRLVLWNDETNTFDHVIHCLMKHLQYSERQAEQIAWKVHNEGKCTVLEGSYTEMEIYRKILKSEGLSVSVE
ncbi:ATP-dependent Clp protease adaptor ClpS [Sphingobacterium psychroaquaticum]|uniref:ATP-dependent Clp protease adaptor protein ClpS n=1 Tax=Sphingobacterium psychroaquaticum TaxID=561061 RepID=A0A1X7LBY0_9SPHI|nr:ATP-dependent Clp protease adaptor ClpS [Sphingobacterium psychroaquaticum]QBQ40365.1 ATP-dependent Clp protease adaptor ClpS [Sphingobacterium psychroaquaticum]SMG51368.1 ATP-dependent Clp protease adaptor protein ClpS [Sphingobacterium psychroaquaticum]